MNEVIDRTGIAEGSAPAASSAAAVMRGLWWREWLAHGRLITGFAVLWLVGLFVLELFFHPGFMLGFGVLYALIVGTACGGAEAVAGTEEFTFALPATRSERYLARLALAGGVLALAQTVGLAAIALDLPQALWRLVVDSGFTEPFSRVESRYLYWLAAALPFADFAATFAFTANSNERSIGVGFLAGALGPFIAATVMGLGFLVELMLWGGLNGYVSCPALFALTPLALQFGHRAYVRKEGISGSGSAARRNWWWFWLVTLGLLLVAVLWMMSASRVRYESIRRAEENQLYEREKRMRLEVESHPTDTGGPAPAVPAANTGVRP